MNAHFLTRVLLYAGLVFLAVAVYCYLTMETEANGVVLTQQAGELADIVAGEQREINLRIHNPSSGGSRIIGMPDL